jgi:release factor glutamine methyltransferase
MSESDKDQGTWSLRRIVRWMTDDFSARGMDSPRLDAELLAAHALGIDRVRLYMDLERPLVNAELEGIRELVRRRRKREPIAYILGRREFYGLSMKVSPAVLIPRPETELLVERALLVLPEDGPSRVLDVCTGSGCVAVAIAKERPLAIVVASDLSPEALEIARANVEAHQVTDRVRIVQGDLFAALAGEAPFDVITANPPYLRPSELAECAPDVKDFEPTMALVAEHEGFLLIERLAAESAAHLVPGGRILVEVGAGQAPRARALFSERGFTVEVHRDLAGIERTIEAVRS